MRGTGDNMKSILKWGLSSLAAVVVLILLRPQLILSPNIAIREGEIKLPV